MRTPLPVAETALLRALVLASEEEVAFPDSRDRIDWAVLAAAADRHRLGPLAFLGLSRIPDAPAPVRARFENLRHLELAKAAVRLHHLDELGDVSRAAGLDLCLLKGAAFASALYRDPGLRPMSDIDVLSTPSAFESWSREIEGLGYSLVEASDHARCYRRRATGVVLELHHALTSSASFLGLETEALFERSRPHEGRLRTLSWEDHLLHLTLHASFQHGFRQAGVNAWDARTIAGRGDFDLDAFLAIAGGERLARWVYGGLAMTGAVFDSPNLASARRALEPAMPSSLKRRASNFRSENLLAPDREAVFGSPGERIRWSGCRLTTLSLLWEISRPRGAGEPPPFFGRPRRILQLLRNHGFVNSGSTSNRTPVLTMGSTPASLGEARDV